jgi:hypothetical protein
MYLAIGALVVAVAVMGYQLYQDRKQPEGRHRPWPKRRQDRKEIALRWHYSAWMVSGLRISVQLAMRT